jgi:hypothetical protein
MARDRSKNAYYTAGIPRNSETLRKLQQDSEQTGVSIPQLIAVRTKDWYELEASMRLVTDLLNQVVRTLEHAPGHPGQAARDAAMKRGATDESAVVS